MNNLSTIDVIKLAELSKLRFSDEKLNAFTHDLENILTLIKKIDTIDTKHIEPLAHPFEAKQPLRDDVVSEKNQRDLFQRYAPSVEAGLYIVPKFVESE